MNKEQPYNVTLLQDNGNVSLDFNGGIIAIEINYSGDCSIHNHTKNKLELLRSSNKIIMFAIKKTEGIKSGDILFKYFGKLLIKSCNVYNINSESAVKATIDSNVDIWNKINNQYSDLDGIVYENKNKNYRNRFPKHSKENNKFDKFVKTKKSKSKSSSGSSSGSSGGGGGY